MPDRTEIIRDYSRFTPHTGPLDEKLVQALMDSFQERLARGEEPLLVDLLAAVNADDPDKLDIADGLHRFEGLRRMGLPVRASIRGTPYKKGEVTRIRATTLNRKNAKPFELADIATTHKRVMGFESWAETAVDLDWSEATMSRVRRVSKIPPNLRPRMEPLGATVTQLIATIATVEQMTKAIDFAHGAEGKPATKEQVERYIKRLRGEGKAGAKKRYLEGKIGGRPFRILLKPADNTLALRQDMADAARGMAKFDNAPPDSLGFLFA